MDHPVLVNPAEPHHRSGRKQVEDHFLRGAGLQPRRAGNRFRPGVRRDGDARLARERRARIRGHADRDRAAPPREFERAEHVGRRAARGNSDDHVAARYARARKISRAIRRGIFRAFGRMPQRPRAAGDDGLHHFGRRPERRRTFRRVEHREAPAGSRADVKKPAAAAKGFHDGVHCARDFRQFAANGKRHARVLAIQNAQDFERGFPVESARTRISLFCFADAFK